MDSTAADLSDDLILEIFSWLPAESVLCFRCVSKTINAVTRTPDFVMWNLSRRPHQHGPPNLYHSRHKHIVTPEGVPKGFFQEHCCVASANGLLLMTNEHRIPIDYFWNQPVLCNPLTGDSVKLPRCEIWKRTRFGFTPRSNEYKVVAMDTTNYWPDYKEDTADIYYDVCTIPAATGVPGPWRTAAARLPMSFPPIWKDSSAPVVNGRLHFVRMACYSVHPRDRKRITITAFDLNDELLRDVPPPQQRRLDEAVGGFYSKSKLHVGDIGGCLALLQIKPVHSDQLVVWVMRDYGDGESWAKKFSFGSGPAEQVISPSPSNHHFCIRSLYLEGGSENTEKLICYDMLEEKYHHVRSSESGGDEAGRVEFTFGSDFVVPFVGCLFTLKPQGHQQEDGDQDSG